MSKNTYEDCNKGGHPIKEIEDGTKYGEFVSSYFAWLTLERQKKNAKEMEQMTTPKKQEEDRNL